MTLHAIKEYVVEYGYEAPRNFNDAIKCLFEGSLETGYIREYDGGYDLECERYALQEFVDNLENHKGDLMYVRPGEIEEFKAVLQSMIDGCDQNDDTLHFVAF